MTSEMEEEFVYFTNIKGATSVVTLSGRVLDSQLKDFEDCLSGALTNETNYIILRFQNLSIIEKAAFSVLAKFKLDLKHKDCEIAFCQLPKHIEQDLYDNGLISSEEIFPDLTTALQSFHNMQALKEITEKSS
jgi:anti-anti-sigma regulatory factor